MILESLVKWRAAGALALFFPLAGCFGPMKAPNSGPMAELTVSRAEGATSAHIFPFIYDRPDCYGTGGLLPRMDRETMDERVTKIVAERPTWVRLSSYDSSTGVSCIVGVIFDPEDGARYKAIWSTASNKCYVRLGRLTNSNGQDTMIPEPSTRPGLRC